jgi:hypothetical protein
MNQLVGNAIWFMSCIANKNIKLEVSHDLRVANISVEDGGFTDIP